MSIFDVVCGTILGAGRVVSFLNDSPSSFKVGSVDIDGGCYDSEVKESLIDGCSKMEAETNALSK